MGSPASPLIANILMGELLNHTVNKLRRPQRLLTKYVDDLFAEVNENEVQTTLDRNVKFIFEMEATTPGFCHNKSRKPITLKAV